MSEQAVWTRRGRFVRNLLLVAAYLMVANFLMGASLPEECRGVSVHEMSERCLRLVTK